MCRAKCEGGRRCDGGSRWYVNRESHDRWAPDVGEERHWFKPAPLLSMTRGAIRIRRMRAQRYIEQVDAMRTVNGVALATPLGPVLREELWQHRDQGAALSLIILANRFRAIAAEEGVPIEQVADRYAKQQVRPHRQRAGERLAHLVVDKERPDWVDTDRLVRMVEPLDNGTPSEVYVRVVRDLDGKEFILVTTYDGSEPMAWAHDAAGLKSAAWEALERVRAVAEDAERYDAWLTENGATDSTDPFTQDMSAADFLGHSDHMHLM